MQQPNKLHPDDALHIYTENEPGNRYNECTLKSLPDTEKSILSNNENPKNCSMTDVLQAQNRKQSDTGGLALLLIVKANARVMVITNIDLSDRLMNGQIGVVKYFAINQNEVETIYAAFDDIPGG